MTRLQIYMFNKDGYVDIKGILREYIQVNWFNFIGIRGSGKTYGVKEHLIEEFIYNHKKFIYVRRWEEEISTKYLFNYFDDVLNDIQYDFNFGFSKYTIRPKNGKFYIVGYEQEPDAKLNYICEIGTITTLTAGEKFKGGTYLGYSTIFFDEITSRRGYKHGDKEPELFDDIINTVARTHNPDIKIILCGNETYSIENCPYFKPLHLDYEHLQDNTVYLYDTYIRDNNDNIVKTIANNALFMKIVKKQGHTYLNENVSSLFNTSVEKSSNYGGILIDKYANFTLDMQNNFIPIGEMQIETGIITDTCYHKSLWGYIGYYNNQPLLVILNHSRKYDNIIKLFCRYDIDALPYKTDAFLTYRINIPQDKRLEKLRYCLNYALVAKIICGDDKAISLFYDILKNS